MFTVIPAILSAVLYRKHFKKTSREEEHIYDYIEPSSPPQLPPSQLTTHDNPAYERFELKDCEAYSNGLKTVETVEPSGPPQLPPSQLTTHDNPAYERFKLKDCEAYSSGLNTVV